jgi:hypothetical protein
MVNIDDFTQQKGMFLRADDVLNSPEKTFVITGESALVENEKFGGQRLHIPGTFHGEEKTFDCSKTNARTIVEALGTSETAEWTGVILVLETYRTKISDGRMVDAINVAEVKKPGAAAPAATTA